MNKPTIDSNVREIRVAATDEEILATYPVMSQLRPEIQKSDYLRIVNLQHSEVGFQVAMLTEHGRITCVAGLRVCRSLGWGKYLYVDDLVTDEQCRSKGSGKIMFDWLVEHARALQCQELRLDSAVYRREAHRFYFRERMDIACFHFCLKL
ncbi:MAG: GNAT family N-acetyltransferase [Candidatus Sulfotelmatobacter sp.]